MTLAEKITFRKYLMRYTLPILSRREPMAILPGRRLGPYEILSSVGAGGMGEVYRARDPRLNRDVAIKVSNAQFTERFDREAKAIAALNHPNICQIYDVGPNYLVMEYIEGESPKGPLPLDEALRIARQIAHALEAAHDKGITHRDLKPANIKIKPDGTVKVLDFGLAKVNAAPSASQHNSPTLSMDMTQAGMILGTASYMAPEQAPQNTSVLWIFDAIRGSSTRFTFDSGLDSDPVWSPDGRTIIFTSRQKQYGDLYRKSADGSGNEELIYSDNTEKTPTHISPDGKFLLYRALGTGTGDDIWVLPLTPERPGVPPKPYPFAQSPADEDDAQFSPDGRWIAYNSTESQRQEVYLAHFSDGGGKRQISVTGGTNPRWRKDGKEIFYVAADGKVMAAAVTFKGDAIQVGEVRPLFTPPAGINIDTFEVSADGQRFLILPQLQTLNEGVIVVLNWAAGLKK